MQFLLKSDRWPKKSLPNHAFLGENGLTVDRFKRQKPSEEYKVDDIEDRISNLPDHVIQHILSFLETKDAFVTDILSKRWRYLWTGLRILDFDDKPLYSGQSLPSSFSTDTSSFINFVERVLLLRDTSNIERFRLSCRVWFIAPRVHSWITSAIKDEAKELDICLFVQDTFLLPQCVFNSQSLTCLKLDMNCNLQLPSRISFPSLKILQLGLVTFQDDESVERLFSSCPVLEELAILDCEWIELKSIRICIPSLKSLRIDDLPVGALNSDAIGCEIKIDAAKLSFFKYYGYLVNDIQLSNVPPSVKATLDIRIPPIQPQFNDNFSARAVELFQNLKNVGSLEICNNTFEALTQENVLDHLPAFQKLTHLEMITEVKEHNVGFLIKFLEHLPMLESLHFAEGFESCWIRLGNAWAWESVPNLLLSHLKTMDLHKYHGDIIEICFLKTLLQSAPCLEMIHLFSTNSYPGKFKESVDLLNQLEYVLRRSNHFCGISVS